MMLTARALEVEGLLERRKKRFPYLYDGEDLSQIFSAHLFHVEKPFLAQMTSLHLTRLICLHHHLKKKIESYPLISSVIELKVRPSYLHEQRSLTISLAIAPFCKNEVLGEEQIIQALSSLISGIKMLRSSFYSYQLVKEGILLCHFEIERVRGRPLGHEEISLLQKRLSYELKKNIQLRVPPLIIPRNDEEILKNILLLSQEFQHPTSIPEVIISFQSQNHTTLSFQIIVVKTKEATQSKWLDNTPFTRLKSYTMYPIAPLEGGHQREAWVCEVEIDGELFAGANGAIDLRQARKYLVKILQESLGRFRDYHGGLFSLQDSYFEKLKQRFERKYEQLIPIMGEIFHGFPLLFQMLCSEAAMEHLLSLFADLQNQEVPKGEFYAERRTHNLVEILGLKTSPSYAQRDIVLEKIESFGGKGRIDGSIGASCIEHRGAHYIFLVNLNARADPISMKDLADSLNKGLRKEGKKQSILRVNFQEGDLPSLNPHVGVNQCARTVGRALFEMLTRLSPEGIPELAAAQEVQVSAHGKLYTFTLRKHHWSNGAIVTAHDFERAWKKALNKKSPCLRSNLFYIIRGAREGTPKVKAITSSKLIVELERPEPYFLHMLAHPIFAPAPIGMEEPNCFNGPFIVKKWARDRHLFLGPNPYYWDREQMRCDEVTVSFCKDSGKVYEMFAHGELDWIGNPFSTECLDVSLLPHGMEHQQKVNRVCWIYLNTHLFPFNSTHIRRALGLAINREKLISKLLPGSLSLISPIPDRKLKNKAQYDGNSKLATWLFAKGLKELGLTQETFPILTFHYPSSLDWERFAKELQRQLKGTLGIECRLIELSFLDLEDMLDKKNQQFAGTFLGSFSQDPLSYLEIFRDSTSFSNPSQWENRAYQLLLDQIYLSKDPTAREKLCEKTEQFLLKEMPIIPILQPVYRYFLNREQIESAPIDQNGEVDFKWVRVVK